MSSKNVIELDDRRLEGSAVRVSLEAVGRVATTGTHPFLGLASDGNSYWCKRLHSNHEWQAAVNEIAASVVGQALGAPVRTWKIVNVPASLRGMLIPEAGYRLGDDPLFGSHQLHTADLALDPNLFEHVRDDSNYNRIPHLIALQLLCNAQDIQLMYDMSDDFSIWSIDHGLWFGSNEFPWDLQDESTLYGRTVLPRLSTTIDSEHWNRAIHSVRNLPDDLDRQLALALPREWEIDSADSDRLMAYVNNRRSYAIDRLGEFRNIHGRK